jgi:hypothetical protein
MKGLFRPEFSVLVLLIGLSVGASAFEGEVELVAAVTPSRITTAQTATLDITLSWPGSYADVQVDGDVPLALDRLELARTAIRSGARQADGGSSATHRMLFTLRPLEVGTGVLHPAEVTLRVGPSEERRILRTPRLTIEIIPAPRPFPWAGVGIAAGVLVLVGGLIWVVLLWRRRRRRQARREPERTPEEKALLDLEAARRHRIEGDFREYYACAEAIIREWLCLTHGLESATRTTTDLKEDLAALELDDSARGRLMAILDEAEQVKFGGREPVSYEVDRFERTVQGFFGAMLPDKEAETPDLEERLLEYPDG